MLSAKSTVGKFCESQKLYTDIYYVGCWYPPTLALFTGQLYIESMEGISILIKIVYFYD